MFVFLETKATNLNITLTKTLHQNVLDKYMYWSIVDVYGGSALLSPGDGFELLVDVLNGGPEIRTF